MLRCPFISSTHNLTESIVPKVMPSPPFDISPLLADNPLMVTKKKQTKNIKKLYAEATYGIAIVLAVISLAIGIYFLLTNLIPTTLRKDRIDAIYASLNIGDDYSLVRSDVFGKKRVYEWDSSRTYSSSKSYTHNANVDVTVADLRAKIEAANFRYFDEPYPGSTYTQLHFKSAKGEYVRLTVSSKPRDDVLTGNTDPTDAEIAMDPNAGPSNVTIKVNLDDNNE